MKRYRFDLWLTMQGDEIRAWSWYSDEMGDEGDFMTDVKFHLENHLTSALSEGDWEFKLTRTELPPEDHP